MSKDMDTGELGERAQHLLKVLVEHYLKDGQPVGSRTLSKGSGLDLSPATIRNVMADLEEMGFVLSPHTSAGRVPTVQGYRFFVDSLLTVQELDGPAIARIRSEIEQESNSTSIAEHASQLLSQFTHFAGIVTAPRHNRETLRQVDFLPLTGNQVLVVLVLNHQDVQNRIIRTDRAYTSDELRRASNYVNANYAGRELSDVREQMLSELESARQTLNQMMITAVEVAQKGMVSDQGDSGDLFVSGQTNLMDFGELADMSQLRSLFDAFSNKRDLLHLLEQSHRAPGVHLFIGEESGFEVLDSCSVVTASYELDGEPLGVLGVIGPTRMSYERVIPIVDVTAKMVTAALNRSH
jgi:heat-inducible transcriptional repressor